MGSIVFGSFVGSLFISALTFFQSEEAFHLWGWRIPFIAGGVLCVIGSLLRRNLNETPEFLMMKKNQKNVSVPFLTLIKKYKLLLLKGILIAAPTAVTFTYYLLMPNSFLQSFYSVSVKNIIYLSAVALVINAFFAGLGGYLGDKWNPKKMYILGISLLCIWVLASHFIFLTHNISYIYASIVIMAVCIGMPTGSLFHMVLKMLPTEVRASGIAVVLNIVNGIIVGNIPLFFSFVVQASGLNIFPPIFLGTMCFVGILVISLGGFRSTPPISCKKLENFSSL